MPSRRSATSCHSINRKNSVWTVTAWLKGSYASEAGRARGGVELEFAQATFEAKRLPFFSYRFQTNLAAGLEATNIALSQ